MGLNEISEINYDELNDKINSKTKLITLTHMSNVTGSITNIDNEDLVYGTTALEHPGIIIASNSKQNHKKICSQVKEIIRQNAIYP